MGALPARPVYARVDLGALAHNLRAVTAASGGAKIMAVVKANAYGHGLVPVAQLFERLGADALAVAVPEEGAALRAAGVAAPILVMGALLPQQFPILFDNGLAFSATAPESLAAIDAAAAERGVRAPVHLKLDTGMQRVGVQWRAAGAFIEQALRCKHVQIAGVYSHFAAADEANLASARLQLECFLEALQNFERLRAPLPLRHIANSGAVLQLPEAQLDLVRPGILLYGVYPSDECARSIAVRPALGLHAAVTHVKQLAAGTPVSYGGSWQSAQAVTLATLPIGYGDGYMRALSSRAPVLLRGKRYGVAGRVCMDQLLVNVAADTVDVGETATLLGSDGTQEISAAELAQLAGTIAYEVLTNIGARVPRVYAGP